MTSTIQAATIQAASFLPDWMNPEVLIPSMGSWVLIGLCAILFAECALLLGFFLPGDTLLFFAGIFWASGAIGEPLWLVLTAMMLSAFVGNMVGYWIGYKVGPAVFANPSAKFLKPQYIEKSHHLFERWGKPAVVLSRFLPVIRTITPPMAGASRMNRSIYTTYSALGGVLWVGLITALGIWLGKIAFIRDNLDLLVVAAVVVVILASAGPAIFHFVQKRKENATATPEQLAAEDAYLRDQATVEAPDDLGGIDPEKRNQ